MLTLRRLEVQGFGPFADRQIIEFPERDGVTVVYGDNMRGKTSLLNAIRYAFFGTVLGRGARVRGVHTISNRELASQGTYGFSVSLAFVFGDDKYELVRECRPKILVPTNDLDYDESVLLRQGRALLGPDERERALQQVFPEEVSRFFLFDGELLQEYEELLINESEAGPRISEAIERILGVPILKRARLHLIRMSEEADKQAAKEAQKHQETSALGTALQQATERKQEHQREHARLQLRLKELTIQRADLERVRQSSQKYEAFLQERDDTENKLKQTAREQSACLTELQSAMSEAWRSLVREPIKMARAAAQAEVQKEMESYAMSLRVTAMEKGHCSICDQDVSLDTRRRLKATLPDVSQHGTSNRPGLGAMARWSDLNRISEFNNVGEVRQLFKRLNGLQLEEVTLKDRLVELDTALSDTDTDTVRHSKANFQEICEKIAAVKKGIEDEGIKVQELDANIQRLKKRLESFGTSNQRVSQSRAKMLRDAAEVFCAAVEQYKSDLRSRVEATSTQLFLSMTTEKQDYAGLTINEAYGLTIRHRDGRAEEARSAGAEHVVALALMGALQRNAALRGPIVTDSPFGRLDEKHTANVIRTLPQMAGQVVLLVHEKEIGRTQMRSLLGSRLVREYELERISSRRTIIRQVK